MSTVHVNDSKMNRLLMAAAREGCKKSRRGVILLPKNGGEYWGRNRPAVGDCDGSETCRRDCSKICVHAEQDVLAQAGPNARGSDVYHLKVVDGEPVVSGDPSCVECSKLMLRAGVARVWLFQESGWRSWTAQEFHLATLANLGLHPKIQPLRWWRASWTASPHTELCAPYLFRNSPLGPGGAHIFIAMKGGSRKALCSGKSLEPGLYGTISDAPCPDCLAKGEEVKEPVPESGPRVER